MNPLLLPPRLGLRALDDLHTLARASGEIAALVRALERVDARFDTVVDLGERIEMQGARSSSAPTRIDGRAGELVDRLDTQAAAREVADRGAALAEALPVIQRAVEMAEPLEGAVERLGRIVDRLPRTRRGA